MPEPILSKYCKTFRAQNIGTSNMKWNWWKWGRQTEQAAHKEIIPDWLGEIKAEAEMGDPASQTNLGICLLWGDGVPKDAVEALRWFRKSADRNGPQNSGFFRNFPGILHWRF